MGRLGTSKTCSARLAWGMSRSNARVGRGSRCWPAPHKQPRQTLPSVGSDDRNRLLSRRQDRHPAAARSRQADAEGGIAADLDVAVQMQRRLAVDLHCRHRHPHAHARLPGSGVPEDSGAGLTKSRVSRRFKALTQATFEEWMASDLSGLDLVAIQMGGLHLTRDMVMVGRWWCPTVYVNSPRHAPPRATAEGRACAAGCLNMGPSPYG